MKKKPSFRMRGRTANLGIMMGVCIAICIFLGYEADRYLGTSPNGIIFGSIFGIITGAVNMWEGIHHLNKKMDKDNDKCKEELLPN